MSARTNSASGTDARRQVKAEIDSPSTYRSLELLSQQLFVVLFLLGLLHQQLSGQEVPVPRLGDRLTDTQIANFAKLALDGIQTEFPNKPSNVMIDSQSVRSPRELHPTFFGCFDWHSSVHGHWMLVRLLREYPECSVGTTIRQKLAENLTAENLKQEAEYFQLKHNRNFERMYGWAWLLRLVTELHQWDDAQGKQWRANLQPLEEVIVKQTQDYLPKLSYPIRTGVHPDTGFALGQILDYARAVGNSELEELIVTQSREYYLADRNYPDLYEPSGEDFFSSGLNEADLMRRILDPGQFSEWLDRFLPNLTLRTSRLFTPVEVSDVTDGKIVHLAGLNLSRGWCFLGIASALPQSDSRREILRQVAAEHAQAGYKYVFSGHYEGEHWLATFAIYLHTGSGLNKHK